MTEHDRHTPAPSRAPGRLRLGLARGSAPWLLPAFALVVVAFVVPGLLLLAIPAGALALAMVWFFRDPERTAADAGFACAADGVVQFIDAQPDGRTRVAVFMNPLNVHVNRAPLEGAVTGIEHRPGGFRPAFDKDSERNERVIWTFKTEIGEVTVVQIAGAMVRRIVPYLAEGQKVEKGQRIGLIRFGSRVDVYLPAGVAPAVEVGQQVRAGETRLDRG
ncbi:phosphatidylserine decarboxylase [Streptomonospora litoralis]|uniref:Phosphatidylserine decarboxylase proenzyme n=1 Tax=Streptomonospora litoralis TaxID=2498135 RepID=A0A4P6Q6Z8_9ACTN|nr:phosphatidylserine decarboxylase [Streptomonospora litoralis]QBI54694.1 phosphatidylserine decarboxylase [Streptomonospora litoralis]